MKSPSATVTISRSFTSRVEPTANVKKVAAAFGIGIDESIEIELYRDVEIEIGPGRIIYFTGESGAGKSCALRDTITQAASDKNGGARLIDLAGVDDIPDAPLVDQFGDRPLDDVLGLLSSVGIAEPFVFLRRPRELSDGQRYRFLLAMAVHDALHTLSRLEKASG